MLDGEGELVAAGYRLRDYVLLFDAGGKEGFAGAGDEGGDYGRVPAGMDDGDAKGGACGGGRLVRGLGMRG